ncbi:FMN-binding glutamate synthase family protein [Aquisalinus flavus]|uniref:FMN-binding glutamate synthase family protein n=2 Tax=Aquisalinus flavus TaxID=1526572 RepID=A0A8J2Y738_9PROT|nr:FMN-binding glutamate synthase family protein [Aquisalinus flavus]UNE46776.1 FMN-binding glutamate synthase family protein [Aquisalinus flavus]GGC97077.1 FMN-binding glutamate synthase family protein [Aquisalinus flavus]
MDWLANVTMSGLDLLASLFVFAVGTAFLLVIFLWIIDKTQTRDSIRHNFPVVGRFRYLFSHLGEFFRQYFFALDREEMPFNRAERDWIYISSKGGNNNAPFGSTRNLLTPGTPIFVPASFATLESQAEECPPVIFGPHTDHPYEGKSIINVSAMSYGSLSAPAIRALSHGAAQAGCWLNTGEGGLSPYHLEGNCDIVFQIGTAKYGARDEDGNFSEKKFRENALKPQVKMIELKLAQGAKPGKGGILPAAKVTREIAMIRGIRQGEASISPNRHPEIDSFDDLLDFIVRLRKLSGKPVGIKTVIGDSTWLDDLCAAVMKRGEECAPDFITLDGGDGGTGAAPLALMDNVGLTLRESLPMLVDGLARNGLRERIKVICSGKLVTPAEVAWAYCAGADAVNSARGFMFAIGCIQAMRCHTNTCPTGVTTHNKRLQAGLNPISKAQQAAMYVKKINQDVGYIAHSCGVPHPRALQRRHVRIVQGNGRSICYGDVYPPIQPNKPDQSLETVLLRRS